ncbi:MAG: 50S ribosomal protein L3 N(5)-glutamine methyltransferase [Burkholderiales bacterium]
MFNEAKKNLQTVRDLLRFGVSRFNEAKLFFGHGTNNAYDETAYLILHTLHLPHDTLDPFLDARLLPQEISAVLVQLEARVTRRVPAAYLTHEAWLGEHKFYVDERVIVPRSFIAELLREQLQPWVESPENIHSALDMCTGSGCLAILTALAFPNVQVDAVDISDDALAVARRNVDEYELEEQVRLVKSDLFSSLKGARYDLIISNPPYVNAESMNRLPQEYLCEPRLALASGNDGLDHIRVILRDAHKYLNKIGFLIVESGHNRDVIESAFPDLPFIWLDVRPGSEYVFLLRTEDLSQ